jgi:hypothetical protein
MTITRRKFLQSGCLGGSLLLLNCARGSGEKTGTSGASFMQQWRQPPRESSQAAFWFWNDDLSEAELSRQMQDFVDHGVYGFVIHPRVGLPRNIGWMSDRMIHFMRYAIEEAKKMDMWVVLYDEGMYPSGASSGQVVAENPAYRPHGLFAINLDEVKLGQEKHGFMIGSDGKPVLSDDQNLIGIVRSRRNGHRIAIIDRVIRDEYSRIRGLHFTNPNATRRTDKKEVAEDLPPLADILNPESVQCFIRLVYQRFYDEFGEYFGNTVKAIFTDEPDFFGKRQEPGSRPGNAGILNYVSERLGEDFTSKLPSLWYDDEPDAEKYRKMYERLLEERLEETYYRPISKWCIDHNIALVGHPADPDDIGHLRHFQIPGQDIVWRYIEPGKPSALEGAQSTQGKCASSAMIHLQRRHNSNEYCGAYGHNFTFREMKWISNWLLVRGCNMLIPHAFYYSIRGPRIDERPPDVGPNNSWWDEYKPFADATSRLSWLNTDSTHICELAILGLSDHLSWRAAKVCFEHQIDFNYLEARHLWEDAEVTNSGIHIAGMHYKALIVEMEVPEQARPALQTLEQAGLIIRWQEGQDESDLLKAVRNLVTMDVEISPLHKSVRIRHVKKAGLDCYLCFNEGEEDITAKVHFAAVGDYHLLDIVSEESKRIEKDTPLSLPAHHMQVVVVGDPALLKS